MKVDARRNNTSIPVVYIYTTLDPDIQQAVEESVYNYKNLPRFQNSAHKFSKQGVEQPQAAVVVMTNIPVNFRLSWGSSLQPATPV